MSKEKQIEGMFNIIVDGVIDGEDNYGVPTGKTCLDIAEALYNAGYRKQGVGEWVTKGDFFKTYHCSLCNYSVDYHWQRTSYCPRCGAKMGGGAE